MPPGTPKSIAVGDESPTSESLRSLEYLQDRLHSRANPAGALKPICFGALAAGVERNPTDPHELTFLFATADGKSIQIRLPVGLAVDLRETLRTTLWGLKTAKLRTDAAQAPAHQPRLLNGAAAGI